MTVHGLPDSATYFLRLQKGEDANTIILELIEQRLDLFNEVDDLFNQVDERVDFIKAQDAAWTKKIKDEYYKASAVAISSGLVAGVFLAVGILIGNVD